MVQTPTKPLTLTEFLALPETKPASEFINQQIIPKPMPQGKHSTIQGEFVVTVNRSLKPDARAFPELRCTFGDRSIVPDVSVFTSDRIPRDQQGEIADAFPLAPNWTIEILSPDQSYTKVVKNILSCLQHGAQMGWLIDPGDRSVFVYRPGQPPLVFDLDDPQTILPVPDFAQSVQLTVQSIFGWLNE
jgi:Uma2 family endonuclease